MTTARDQLEPDPPPEPRPEAEHEPEADGASFPLRDFLGFTVDRPEPGRSVTTVDVGPVHHNPNGVAHGAVLFAIVDTGMGAAVTGVLEDRAQQGIEQGADRSEERPLCATIEIQLRFLRPVLAGRLTAETLVVHPGHRIMHLESVVTDDQGRRVAMATGSFAVLEARS